MPGSEQIQNFSFGSIDVQLLVPGRSDRPDIIRSDVAAAPYWQKLWPSALALSSYIVKNPELILGKKVLELAAGLGLPGIVAAHLASEVVISDYMPEAVAVMQESVQLNRLTNVACRLIDWGSIPPDLGTDVVLVSDINYDPSAFERLYQVLLDLLRQGCKLVLATPQRLLAKPFIERILPFCNAQDEQFVLLNEESSFISLFVLSLSNGKSIE